MIASVHGDTHNFGKRVKLLPDGSLFKPRCLLWEQKILSRSSPFRCYLESLFSANSTASPFRFAPHLDFKIDKNFVYSGSVTPIQPAHQQLTDLGSELDACAFQAIGSMIGLCVWLGINDIHHENIFWGKDQHGKLVFFPIDIECIFDKLILPSQTSLIPNSQHPEESHDRAGVFSLRQQLTKIRSWPHIAALISGFTQTVETLQNSISGISDVLMSDSNIDKAPIRMVPRATQIYFDYLKGKNPTLKKTLLNSELEQLSRGDIPYFFRFLNSPQVYNYTTEDGHYRESDWRADDGFFDLPKPAILNRNEPETFLGHDFELSQKAGALQLASFFGKDLIEGISQFKDCTIKFEVETIEVEFSGKKYFCSRGSTK